VLVTALGDDPAGRRVAELLAAAGVRVVAGRLSGRTPAKERVRVAGQSLLRLDREEAAPAPPAVTEAMTGGGAVGRSRAGVRLRSRAGGRPGAAGGGDRGRRAVPVVWDPHPRGPDPVPGARLVTPNLAEALRFTGRSAGGGTIAAAARAGLELVDRWRVAGVAVTLGSGGALLAGAADDVPLVVPAPPIGAAATRAGPATGSPRRPRSGWPPGRCRARR
jgi:bifunctional ADP-heptose synthase (sugar kinase/adenylyltransferase)